MTNRMIEVDRAAWLELINTKLRSRLPLPGQAKRSDGVLMKVGRPRLLRLALSNRNRCRSTGLSGRSDHDWRTVACRNSRRNNGIDLIEAGG